jgi:hypothetical protein
MPYRCSSPRIGVGERMRRPIQSKQYGLFAAPDTKPQMFAVEMRIELVSLLGALLLEVISGQFLKVNTAVEEQEP